MTKIKICGITNRVDAMNAATLGADAVGFVFSKSPRQINPKEAKKIIQILPPYISTVGVFVNEPAEKVNEIMSFCNLNIAQLHGNESNEYCKNISHRIVKSFIIKNKESIKPISKYSTSAVLLDTYSKDLAGGTGKTFDWDLAVDLSVKYFVILAGGLNLKNVKKAIELVNPYAVDVSSGVEISPGKKDFDKMQKFIKKVKGTKVKKTQLF